MPTFHTITIANYRQRLPSNVIDVYINEDVLQLPDRGYQEIFKDNDEYGDLNDYADTVDNQVNVVLPESINEIRDSAFYDCNTIKSIIIPNNVTRIGQYAFYNCMNIKFIKLSDNLQEIEKEAFNCCRKLKEVTIPDSVTTLGNSNFYQCFSLESVTLSKSLNSIGELAFTFCHNLRSVIIPEGVTIIGINAFDNCKSLHSVVLPQSLQEIQQYGFSFCYSLFSIYIPTSVTTIHRDAFQGCIRLENIIIPENCTHNSIATYNNKTKRIYGKKWTWNYLDNVIQEEGPDWLKNRFDNLPLHQLCYNPDITIEALTNIPNDEPFLQSVDKMNMTPLHVLSCNPNTTLEMIQTFASKCPDAALVKTKNDTFPVDLYHLKQLPSLLVPRDDHFLDGGGGVLKYNKRNEIMKLMNRGTKYTIHDVIECGVDYDMKLWDILLAFQGSSVSEQLSSQDNITGLFPLMTAAVVKDQPLDLVYKLAMVVDPIVFTK